MVYFTPEARINTNRAENSLSFFIISKQMQASPQYIPIYKSEITKAKADGLFKWNEVMLSVA